MRRFAWADAKATLRTAVCAFAWTTGGLGLALFAAVVLNPSRGEPLTAESLAFTFVAALLYAAVPGMVAAAAAALYRLAGAWAFVPLVVFPLMVIGVFWLGRDLLAGQERDIVNAFGAQFKALLSGSDIRVHGIEGLLFVLLFFGLLSALQPVVLWQLFQYLVLVGAFVGTALLLTCAITVPPLLFAIVRRAAWRYAKHVALG